MVTRSPSLARTASASEALNTTPIRTRLPGFFRNVTRLPGRPARLNRSSVRTLMPHARASSRPLTNSPAGNSSSV
ncbi:MAG: hypothetical protein LW650_00855 [Planctomycetaceae bacterium]|nr:hypothetical protein [Planctomycetaceae bacterium]